MNLRSDLTHRSQEQTYRQIGINIEEQAERLKHIGKGGLVQRGILDHVSKENEAESEEYW